MKDREILTEYYHILKMKPDKSRKSDQVKARAAMMVAMRENGLLLGQIGNLFDVDHTTVVHHVGKHESNLIWWEGYRHKYNVASGLCGHSIRDKATKWKIRNLTATINRLSSIKEKLEKQLNQNSYE